MLGISKKEHVRILFQLLLFRCFRISTGETLDGNDTYAGLVC